MTDYEYPPEWDVRDREGEHPDWSDPDIEALADAYHRGISAHSVGRPLSDNPFMVGVNPEVVEVYAREWHHGWRDSEHAESLR